MLLEKNMPKFKDKYFYFILGCVAISQLLVQCSTLNQTQIKNLSPKVSLIYIPGGTIFDKTCTDFLAKSVKREWIEETNRRLQEFQNQWDKDGEEYMRIVFEETRIPFPYKEVQATLTVCDFPTMSSPLMINVRHFMSTNGTPYPNEAFSEILFHELMHTYVRCISNTSVLRKKYATESPVVLNHLHVMALEKFVLLKSDNTSLLRWLENEYRSDSSYYRRAWQIVNDIEDYKSFVDEFKKALK